MFFFHFFHIVNFNFFFFFCNLGYLSFHPRQFFLVIAFLYCVFILDVISKQDLHMWSLSFSLPIILTWLIYRKRTVQWNFFALRGNPFSNVRIWKSNSSSRNNLVIEERLVSGAGRSAACWLLVVFNYMKSACSSHPPRLLGSAHGGCPSPSCHSPFLILFNCSLLTQ